MVLDLLHLGRYCVEIPLGGERLFEGGDIRLLEMIKEFNSSSKVIVFFCVS